MQNPNQLQALRHTLTSLRPVLLHIFCMQLRNSYCGIHLLQQQKERERKRERERKEKKKRKKRKKKEKKKRKRKRKKKEKKKKERKKRKEKKRRRKKKKKLYLVKDRYIHTLLPIQYENVRFPPGRQPVGVIKYKTMK